MSRVFISYRRDDAADVTGRIFDKLQIHFSNKVVVFRDVDGIPLGTDFRKAIAKALDGCEVLLAVIGPSWVDVRNEDGARRLDDPNDFVRLEIEMALNRTIPVIPLLVSRAKMPRVDQLPDSIQSLAYRHGLEIRRDPDFHNDVNRLIGSINVVLKIPSVADNASSLPFAIEIPDSINVPATKTSKPIAPIPKREPPARSTKVQSMASPRLATRTPVHTEPRKDKSTVPSRGKSNRKEEAKPRRGILKTFTRRLWLLFTTLLMAVALLVAVGVLLGLFLFRTSSPTTNTSKKSEVISLLRAGEEREFEIADNVKMVFCWIPPGEAQLGSPKEEQDYITNTIFDGNPPDWMKDEADEKRGKFRTKGFWMGKYTVTQAEWRAVMGENPSYFDGIKENEAKELNTDRFPVESVNWFDCHKFLEKVNLRQDVAKVFGGSGQFVLPHEDEWEYACRGGKGNKQPFYFGNELNGNQANCDGNTPFGTTKKGPYLERPTPVGSYADKFPHPWGLCDMHGNVWEWCENVYEQTDIRVLRGGAWGNNPDDCRAACRDWGAPADRDDDCGFRVCLRLD